MKKFKRLSLLLAALFLLGSFASCKKNDTTRNDTDLPDESKAVDLNSLSVMNFSDVAELKSKINNSVFYVCESNYDGSTIHYKFCTLYTDPNKSVYFDLSRSSGESLEDMFVNMLTELKDQGDKSSYNSVHSFLMNPVNVSGCYLDVYEDLSISVDNSGLVNEVSGKKWIFLEKDYLKYNGDIYKATERLTELEEAFDCANNKIKQIKKEEFESKYQNALTYREVQYDPYKYLGQDFALTGTAELDDYYNFDYRGLEAVYFCISVTPSSGSYSDRWYIYANRNEYTDLYEKLLNGSVSKITLISQTYFPDAAKHKMATLSDYFIE